jgi:outer membrane murein-binding lipoprotein Lpp
MASITGSEGEMSRLTTGLLVAIIAGLVVVAAASLTKIDHLEQQLDDLSVRVDQMEAPRAIPAR